MQVVINTGLKSHLQTQAGLKSYLLDFMECMNEQRLHPTLHNNLKSTKTLHSN